MAQFKENTLNPEEELTGFNPGEPDDDTFQLGENDSYKGEMPEFSPIESDFISAVDESLVESTQEEIEEDLPDEDDESVFEETPEKEEDVADTPNENIDDIPEGASAWDAFGSDDDQITDDYVEKQDETEFEELVAEEESDVSEEIIDFDDDNEEFEEENLEFDEYEEAEEEIAQTSNEGEQELEKVELDENFKELLKSDLEKSQAAKKQEAEAKEDLAEESEPFVPVEDKEETDFIDLSNISDDDEDEKPKEKEKVATVAAATAATAQAASKVESNAETAKDAEPKEEPAKANVPPKSENKQVPHERKFPFLHVALTALFTMMLAFSLFWAYLSFFGSDPSEEIASKLGEEKIEQELSEDSKTSKETSELLVDEKSEITSDEKTEEKSELSIFDNKEKVAKQTEEIKTVPKENKKTEKVAKSTTKPVITTKPKSKEAEKQAEIVTKTETTSSTKTSETIDQKAINETFADGATQNNENKLIEKNVVDSKEGEEIYSVQVYSSPSREDADMWLDKLKNKRIDDAFISVQLIRGKEWYRVRFGRYSTRDDAKSAALQYGFSQSWIDRIK